MSDIAVSVEDLSKKYCRNLKRAIAYTTLDIARGIVSLPSRSTDLRSGEFWALRDVSFQLRHGECLGLIGPNGSGKSTLLKALNGIIRPDRGRIRIKGRVGALIEVGAGFHPMLSGRENIFVNAAILGMGKQEIQRKLDDIIAFSGLDDAMLDAPVKTYSSGMYVRLGFSVAVHCDPEILLVDEVLAVGDISFIGRCHKRIEQMLSGGVTCVLVSHSLSTIDAFCQRAILLAQGQVLEDGSVTRATTRLRDMMLSVAGNGPRDSAPISGHPGASLGAVHILNDQGNEVSTLLSGGTYRVQFSVNTRSPLRTGRIAIWVQRWADGLKASTSYLEVGGDLPELSDGVYEVEMPFFVAPGEYRVGVTLSGETPLDLLTERASSALTVRPSRTAPESLRGDRTGGVCVVPVELVRSPMPELAAVTG